MDLKNQRPESLPEGYLLHFPSSKSLGDLKKKFFFKNLNKRKGEGRKGRRGERRENLWNIGAQNEREPS